jgi:mannose-6-phosphate isomerase-like protein (cupin superfamily)
MIVVRGKDTESHDWGEKVSGEPIGVLMKWLIHNGVGDSSYGHQFALREITYKPERKPMPMHRHEYVEAVYVISGRTIFTSETGEVEVGPGDVVYGTKVIPNQKEPLHLICVIDCIDDGKNCVPWSQGIIQMQGKEADNTQS